MATPILTDLRSAFPKAEITAMCSSPLGELLKKDRDIDEIFDFQRLKNEFLRRQCHRDVVAKLRDGSFDLGILLTNSFSSAWCFWQGDVKKRVGFGYGLRRLLLNYSVVPPKDKLKAHHVDVYKRLLEPLGIHPSETKPRLFIDPSEKVAAEQLLLQMGYQLGKTLIGINPGAAYGSAKCWPPERFHELAKGLASTPNHCVVFFGDPSQSQLIRKICRGLPENVINLSGATNLRELMAVIQRCDLFITNDSGPMHIAAAFDVPLIAFFGSTDDQLTGPYKTKNSEIINKRTSCSPCFKRTCPIDFRCMNEISVQETLQLAKKKLNKRNAHV